MAYLKRSDITDKAVQDCIADDNDAYLVRADQELESLAESMGLTPPEIGTLAGSVAGTPLVNGGSFSGTSLAVDGFSVATGTIKAGTKLQIQGLAKSYKVSVDASKSGSAVTLTLTDTLEATPADNAPVTFLLLHPDVKEWMKKWVCLAVCLEQIGANDVDNPSVNDKYFTKWTTYKAAEAEARRRITPEMIDDVVESIEQRAVVGIEIYRE